MMQQDNGASPTGMKMNREKIQSQSICSWDITSSHSVTSFTLRDSRHLATGSWGFPYSDAVQPEASNEGFESADPLSDVVCTDSLPSPYLTHHFR